MAGGSSVRDPLGNEIFLTHLYAKDPKQKISENILAEFSEVIQKPAMLLEVKEKQELYYLRVIDWDKKILLIAHFDHNRWESVGHIDNPSSEALAQIMKRGKQLI
jgi:hypothetical protein